MATGAGGKGRRAVGQRAAGGSQPGAVRPAPAGEPLSPAPYALRSPEELHLRDHTRYLLENWQIAVRAVGVLIRGVLVNGLLVGSVIFLAGHLAGWLLGPAQLGVLSGLHTGSPNVHLRLLWLIPVLAATITLGLAWRRALPPRPPAGRAGFVRRASFAAAVVALARATLGRLRTYQADLSTSGPLASAARSVGAFLQRRLVPWAGSVLIVGAIVTLALRWIADGAGRAPLATGWKSQGAQCAYVALAFLLVKALTDINSTSLHAFYRDRLAAAYGVVRRTGPDGPCVQDAPWAQLSQATRRAGGGGPAARCGASGGSFSYGDEDEETGGPHHHLVYLKLTVPAGAPLDVITYQQNHPTFPTDSTLQQLYDDQEFEAYRELGYHCAQAALRRIRYGSADQAGDDAAAAAEPRFSSR